MDVNFVKSSSILTDFTFTKVGNTDIKYLQNVYLFSRDVVHEIFDATIQINYGPAFLPFIFMYSSKATNPSDDCREEEASTIASSKVAASPTSTSPTSLASKKGASATEKEEEAETAAASIPRSSSPSIKKATATVVRKQCYRLYIIRCPQVSHYFLIYASGEISEEIISLEFLTNVNCLEILGYVG